MDITKKLTVTFIDGREPVTTKVTPRGQVAAERQFSTEISKLNSAEQMYYMVWASIHHAGKYSGDFESFLNEVDDITPPKKPSDDAGDPTREAQPPDSSLSSA